jgi:hypothetical protein
MGNNTSTLNFPVDLAFDNEGNLYVCDYLNITIKRFSIINNDPCPATTGI